MSLIDQVIGLFTDCATARCSSLPEDRSDTEKTQHNRRPGSHPGAAVAADAERASSIAMVRAVIGGPLPGTVNGTAHPA